MSNENEWVLVPRDAIECAIETLENDGDEHGEGRNLRAMLDAAPQPPADGGFTAADMMDARQEGRKEAQQPAAVDESFVERFCGRWFQLTGRSLDRPSVRACLTEALAAQQGGSDNNRQEGA